MRTNLALPPALQLDQGADVTEPDGLHWAELIERELTLPPALVTSVDTRERYVASLKVVDIDVAAYKAPSRTPLIRAM